MINFPVASVDGQTFNYNNVTWIWSQTKNRWDIRPNFLPLPLSVDLGGTDSTTASGARTNLGFTKENLGIQFATLSETISAVRDDLFISPMVFVQSMINPAFRFLNPVNFAQNISGTGATSVVNSFGSQMNFPTTRGYAGRTVGTGSTQQMINAINGGINWSKTVIFTGRFRFASPQFPQNGQITRFVFGGGFSTNIGGNIAATGDQFVGLKIVDLGPAELTVTRGSSYVSVSSNVYFSAEEPADFMIMSRNGNVSLYINNVFTVSTDQGPISTAAFARLRIVAETPTATGAASLMYWGGVNVYIE
jgi:hypothetical protein